MADLKKSKIKPILVRPVDIRCVKMCEDRNLTHSTDDVTKHHGIHANPDVFIEVNAISLCTLGRYYGVGVLLVYFRYGKDV